MRRNVLQPRVIVAAVVVSALVSGLVLFKTIAQPGSAGQLLVRGRVLDPGGRPAAGIKVWLNAQPDAAAVRAFTAARQPVPVTVVAFSTTSATGRYAIRVPSLAVLAPDATDGTLTFMLMTGDRAGQDMLRFSRPVASRGTRTADLRLRRGPAAGGYAGG